MGSIKTEKKILNRTCSEIIIIITVTLDVNTYALILKNAQLFSFYSLEIFRFFFRFIRTPGRPSITFLKCRPSKSESEHLNALGSSAHALITRFFSCRFPQKWRTTHDRLQNG